VEAEVESEAGTTEEASRNGKPVEYHSHWKGTATLPYDLVGCRMGRVPVTRTPALKKGLPRKKRGPLDHRKRVTSPTNKRASGIVGVVRMSRHRVDAVILRTAKPVPVPDHDHVRDQATTGPATATGIMDVDMDMVVGMRVDRNTELGGDGGGGGGGDGDGDPSKPVRQGEIARPRLQGLRDAATKPSALVLPISREL
jgi:hypothetical protein